MRYACILIKLHSFLKVSLKWPHATVSHSLVGPCRVWSRNRGNKRSVGSAMLTGTVHTPHCRFTVFRPETGQLSAVQIKYNILQNEPCERRIAIYRLGLFNNKKSAQTFGSANSTAHPVERRIHKYFMFALQFPVGRRMSRIRSHCKGFLAHVR